MSPRFLQKIVHKHTARDTVAIVVAPDGNSLSRENCRPKSLCGARHISHKEWIVEMQVVRRIEEFQCIFFCHDAAAHEKRGRKVVIRNEFCAEHLIERIMEREHRVSIVPGIKCGILYRWTTASFATLSRGKFRQPTYTRIKISSLFSTSTRKLRGTRK